MNDELKQLIEDAAKLIGIAAYDKHEETFGTLLCVFNPCDPERGDLMKVAMAAKLNIDGELGYVGAPSAITCELFYFTDDDHNSLALAVLRAASAVWKARGGE